MENTIFMQAYSFFIYVVSGIIIGIFFDLFRILRKSFSTPDIITYLEDILFWIITGVFFVFILFKFSNGEIRIYHIIGLLIGCIFYMLTISKFFIKINVTIITFIKKAIEKILIILLYPAKIIFKVLKKIFTPFTFFVINIKKYLKDFRPKTKKVEKKKIKKKKLLRKEGF